MTKARLSPDGKLLGTAKGTSLSIRDALSLEVLCNFSCLDAVDSLAWSPDSSLVLAHVAKRDCAQVFSPGQPEFRCKISEGIAGLVLARWAPDSRHVVTFAECNLHATFWSLTDQSTLVLPRVKDPVAGLAWSPDGNFVACATRKDSKDAVAIVRSGGGFPLQCAWPCATHDLASLAWSHDGAIIVVADTCLRYLLLVYSARGEELARFSAYSDALGIRGLSLSPDRGAFLAVGSFDQSVRLVNPLAGWQPVHEYPHAHPKLLPAHARCARLEVFAANPPVPGAAPGSPGAATTFAVSGSGDAVTLPQVPVDETKLVPKLGVGTMLWSHDGRFLATKNENMPKAVWVWDVTDSGLAALLLLDAPVRALKWAPGEHLLALACGAPEVIFWSPGQGPRALPLPALAEQAASALQWGGDGTALLVATSALAVMVPRSAAGEA